MKESSRAKAQATPIKDKKYWNAIVENNATENDETKRNKIVYKAQSSIICNGATELQFTT